MKKKLTFAIFCYLINVILFSQTTTTIGNKSNFKDFIFNDLQIVLGEGNKNYIQIKENEYKPEPDTDLLLHFNNGDFSDEVGNYNVIKHYNNISNAEKKLGNSSSFFYNNKEIIYSSVGDSIFSPGRVLGDFSIEFWLNPSLITEDTTVFSWKGVNKVDSEFISQKIKCYFQERKVIWDFDNFFIPINFDKYSIQLKSKSRIIPNRWNHYLIRYNNDLGLIEFLINGIPEDIKYTTKNEKESNDKYPPYIGNFSKSEIYIGERYSGFIDEFRISESFITAPEMSTFKQNGYFYTPIIDLLGESINLEKIIISDKINLETDATYMYRLSDIPFVNSDLSIKWKNLNEFSPGEEGRYIQIMGNLYSNGSKELSPLLEDISIIWSKSPEPPAPIYITSIAQKNSIQVLWNPIKHYNVDGYYLYYGNESNNYTEMIDVGKNTSYTIENLKYKNIYYFSVRSYLGTKKSKYSIEKYNRPE